MTMTTTDAIEAMMADDESALVRQEVSGLETITRSEVAAQLDAAHRWPRSISKFLREATTLATVSQEIAESCMYSVPRDGKMITGPSVRLAEMIASSWGNLHMGTRIVDVGDRTVTAQAVAWDLEKNARFTSEENRNILTKNGKRYGDAMIQTTCAAAASIAYRNAVFRVVPKAYVQAIYEKARQCAVGDLKTLATRRDEAFARFAKLGVTPERMFARLGIKGADDFTLEHLEQLIGVHTALKSGELQIDEAFPAPAASPVPPGTPDGRRVAMPSKGKKQPTGGEPVANGAAAEVTKASTPPPSATAPAAAPADLVDRARLLQMLREIDPAWDAPDFDAQSTIDTWTERECEQAQTWASGYLGNVPRNVRRPEHTRLARVPGEEG